MYKELSRNINEVLRKIAIKKKTKIEKKNIIKDNMNIMM